MNAEQMDIALSKIEKIELYVEIRGYIYNEAEKVLKSRGVDIETFEHFDAIVEIVVSEAFKKCCKARLNRMPDRIGPAKKLTKETVGTLVKEVGEAVNGLELRLKYQKSVREWPIYLAFASTSNAIPKLGDLKYFTFNKLEADFLPLSIDPVAIHLKLVDEPSGASAIENENPLDPITEAVYGLQNISDISVSTTATDKSNFRRRFRCSFASKKLLIITAPEDITHRDRMRFLRGAFEIENALTAIALVSADGSGSAIFVPAGSLIPKPHVDLPIDASLEQRINEYLKPHVLPLRGDKMSTSLDNFDTDSTKATKSALTALRRKNFDYGDEEEAREFVKTKESDLARFTHALQIDSQLLDAIFTELDSLANNEDGESND